jgi:uncharacterized protein YdhG (YjbR/CyaY superfamily)
MAEFEQYIKSLNKTKKYTQDLWIDERELETKEFIWINTPQLKQDIAIQS